MRSIRLGGQTIAPGEGIAALSRERDSAFERNTHDKQTYQSNVCQCCDFRSTGDEVCVCDGLDWYMLPDGSVECQAHKFARAIGQGKKTFSFFRGSR